MKNNSPNKISFCTVCMNRLYHLRETLPVNIAENQNYPAIEFILLDYNSGDGLEAWVKENMMHYIDSGLLKYYRTYEPVYFNISHSKNMISHLASGNILCMIDADHYAGINYAYWIDSVFANHGRQSIVTTEGSGRTTFGDLSGKLAFHKDLFSKVRGFDESLAGYGMDDIDLLNRLEKEGGQRIFIEDEGYMKFISHSTHERLENYYLLNNLESLYIDTTQNEEKQMRVLYILKNEIFHEITYEFNEQTAPYKNLSYAGWNIAQGGHKRGEVEQTKDGLLLTVYGENMPSDKLALIGSNGAADHCWKKIDRDHDRYYGLLLMYSECLNRVNYNKNNEHQKKVNEFGWGKGTVYLNFNTNTPITIIDKIENYSPA